MIYKTSIKSTSVREVTPKNQRKSRVFITTQIVNLENNKIQFYIIK